MLKVILLCFVSVVYARTNKIQNIRLAPDKEIKVMTSAVECLSEMGADLGLLRQIQDKMYTESEDLKKFLLCAFKKTGVSSKHGQLKVDKFLDMFPDQVDKEALEKVVTECQQKSGEPKDRVYNFMKCYQENTPVEVKLIGN